jgi:hypothetical protein
VFTVTVKAFPLARSMSGALGTSGAGDPALEIVTVIAVAVAAGSADAPVTRGPLNPAAIRATTAMTRRGRRRARATDMMVDLWQQ